MCDRAVYGPETVVLTDKLVCRSIFKDDKGMSWFLDFLIPHMTDGNPQTDLEWVALRGRYVFDRIAASSADGWDYRCKVNLDRVGNRWVYISGPPSCQLTSPYLDSGDSGVGSNLGSSCGALEEN